MEVALLLFLMIVAGCASILLFLPTRQRVGGDGRGAAARLTAGPTPREPPEIRVYERIAEIHAKRAALDAHRARLCGLRDKAREGGAREAALEALRLSLEALERSRAMLDAQEEHWLKLPHEFARLEWFSDLRALAQRLSEDIAAFTAGQGRGATVTADDFDALIERGRRARDAAKPYLGDAWMRLLGKATQLREQLLVYNVMRRMRDFQSRPFRPEDSERLDRLSHDVERLGERAPVPFQEIWTQLFDAIVQFEIHQNVQLAQAYVEQVRALEGAHALYEARGEIEGVYTELHEAGFEDALQDTWRDLQVMLVGLSPELDSQLIDLELTLDDVTAASESLEEVEALSEAVA